MCIYGIYFLLDKSSLLKPGNTEGVWLDAPLGCMIGGKLFYLAD